MVGKKHINYFVVSIILCLSEILCDEKSSLTFVIDDTGSMTDDIRQVKIGANAIFDTVLDSNESQIENFVLVTFNDPGKFFLRIYFCICFWYNWHSGIP